MKKKKYALFPLMLLLLLSLVQVLPAQDSYSDNKEGSLAASGLDRFDISLDNGFTVEIRGTDTDQITYTYTFKGNRLSHEQKFANAEIELERSGARAHLQIRFPDLKDLDREKKSWLQRLFGSEEWETSTEIQELTIEMPRNMELRFRSRYSDVGLTGIERNVTITNRSGSVSATDLNGDLQVSNEYGNTTAQNIAGNVRIDSRSADVELQNIGGTANVSSLYSDVILSNIDKGAEVHTQSGKLDARSIRGPLSVQGNYTTMNINDIEGAVRVQSRSGDLQATNIPSLEFNGEYTDIRARQVTGTDGIHIQGRSSTIDLRNIRGRTVLTGEYMKIRLDNIRENLSISNRSGSVEANHVEGAVRIDGEYNEITLTDFLGSQIHIGNRSDDVVVKSTGTLSEVNIQVTYGDVDFTLANEFQGEYSLEAFYGKVESDIFPAEEIQTDSEMERQSISGIMGSRSNNHFHIRTRNGDITVRKQ